MNYIQFITVFQTTKNVLLNNRHKKKFDNVKKNIVSTYTITAVKRCAPPNYKLVNNKILIKN